MTKIAFGFPGQGSQYVGMGLDLWNNSVIAKNVFDEVNEACSFELSKIMFDGSEDELRQTKNAQPALFACSMAILEVLKHETGKQLEDLCEIVLGHSLGEYSALCAAGSISIFNCGKLISKRAKFMQEAATFESGSMVAIIGVDDAKLKEILNDATKYGTIVVANDNSTGQVVLSGSVEAVLHVVSVAKNFGAKMAVQLPVSGAFHSPLMQQAAENMKKELDGFEFLKLKVSVIANVTADFISNEKDINQLLTKQITGNVRFRESLLLMDKSGVTAFCEVGAKNVLCGLVKRTTPQIGQLSLEKYDDILKYVEGETYKA